jgi:hypothetical protein
LFSADFFFECREQVISFSDFSPMHVGEGIGPLADIERFKEKATVPMIVLPIEK